MKNVTITLDEQTARWARIWAAKHNISVSRLVGQMLHERMLEESGYETAMTRYLSQPPRDLKSPDSKYPSRDELHDRDLLR